MSTRRWFWVDTLLLTLRACWYLMGVLYVTTSPAMDKNGHCGTALLLILTGFLLPMLVYRPTGYPLLYPLAELVCNAVIYAYLLVDNRTVVSIILVPALIVGFKATRLTVWWTLPVFVIGFPLLAYGIDPALGLGETVTQVLNYLLSYGVGLSFDRLIQAHHRTQMLLEQNQQQVRQIEAQNKALLQYANQVEQLTLLEERNRVARDLHDTVGHTFTSVIMGMDAVVCLMDQAPETAKQKLDVLRKLTRSGLDEVRHHIHQIAPCEADGTLAQRLHRLAKEFSAHTGARVNVTVQGEERDLPLQVELTMIRCLQESLTNAKRHGEAVQIYCSIRYGCEEVCLQIEDDGVGAKNPVPGFGLRAMEERLAALGGSLHLHAARGEGMVVTCTVPVRRNER